MKILCVEDGSVNIDALENGELRDGKVLVYRQGSKPPFVLDIPNDNTARVLLELEEIKARIICEIKDSINYNNSLHNLKFYLDRRIESIEKELKGKVGDVKNS